MNTGSYIGVYPGLKLITPRFGEQYPINLTGFTLNLRYWSFVRVWYSSQILVEMRMHSTHDHEFISAAAATARLPRSAATTISNGRSTDDDGWSTRPAWIPSRSSETTRIPWISRPDRSAHGRNPSNADSRRNTNGIPARNAESGTVIGLLWLYMEYWVGFLVIPGKR